MITFGREGPSPRELLEKLLQTDPEFMRQAEERGALVRLPDVKALGALQRPLPGLDANELIKNRFLCRGGSLLLVGPTGVGKSSLSMQAAVRWASGQPFFGLVPAGPLRVLIVQAENDEGDLAEMRDGVIAGLGLPPAEQAEALGRILVVTEDSKTREGFAALLDQILAQYPCDLVIADPAFAYIGGDASSQRDVSPFLRNMLNPVIHRHNVGFLLVHHVNKPPQGEQKGQWQAGDFAYLGSGSAEFANWARAVIAIRSIGSDSVFELMLAKRGRRAGWLDAMGRPANSRYIAYHREPGVICWREAEEAELAPFLPPDKAVTVQTVVDIVGSGIVDKAAVVKALKDDHDVKKATAYRLISEAIAGGVLRTSGPANKQTLILTGKLQPKHRVEDTGHD
jgi:hypothetical protein